MAALVLNAPMAGPGCCSCGSVDEAACLLCGGSNFPDTGEIVTCPWSIKSTFLGGAPVVVDGASLLAVVSSTFPSPCREVIVGGTLCCFVGARVASALRAKIPPYLVESGKPMFGCPRAPGAASTLGRCRDCEPQIAGAKVYGSRGWDSVGGTPDGFVTVKTAVVGVGSSKSGWAPTQGSSGCSTAASALPPAANSRRP